MRNDLGKFESFFSRPKLENLRRNGVIFFDVDDTLLARRKNASESDQIYSESPAAMSVPLLLNAGVRVCLITGHGWAQLKKRFILPLIEDISTKYPTKRDEILKRFFVYANRGATKMIWQNGDFAENENYGREFIINDNDSIVLRGIFKKLAEDFDEDFAAQQDFYRQSFPLFDFEELPPKIVEREKVVLSLRPIPSYVHCEKQICESPRRKLFSVGYELLQESELGAKYELSESGKSTLEIINKAVSKKIAFQDLILKIAEETNISPETVEESSIYVGDEFAPGGNDYIICQSFPDCACFSVASAKGEHSLENVVYFNEFMELEGVSATSFLIMQILKFLT